MYELIQAGEKTYYINCPAKMGLYRLNDSEVCLIDSGNDKDAGKKVLKILEAGGWKLKMVINTHSCLLYTSYRPYQASANPE